jgi:hypothetical protein
MMLEPHYVTAEIARCVLMPTMDWPDSFQKAFGTNYGLTAKVAKDAFHYTKGNPKEHAADNGTGTVVHREFCESCGSFILEYGVRCLLTAFFNC